MDEQQREAFKKALDRKKQAAQATKAPHEHAPHSIESHTEGSPGEHSIRDMNKGHDKRTAG